MGILAPHTEKPLAIRVVLIAFRTNELAILHLYQHAAEGWMTAHWTHCFDVGGRSLGHERGPCFVGSKDYHASR